MPRLIPINPEFVEVDPDEIYRKSLVTCAMNGIEPMSRERALASIQEISDTLSGRVPLPPDKH